MLFSFNYLRFFAFDFFDFFEVFDFFAVRFFAAIGVVWFLILD